MKLFQSYVTILILIILTIHARIAQSSTIPTPGQEKVTPLIKQTLSDVPGQKAIMLTVEFLPGQAAIPHKHPGSVFAYVLKGSIISQLEGQNPVTYHQGQYWYEPPNVGHIICKNASDSKNAKLIVWQFINDNAPALLPYHVQTKAQHSLH
jgi:quercetin dioxygenase-like cupin family protein